MKSDRPVGSTRSWLLFVGCLLLLIYSCRAAGNKTLADSTPKPSKPSQPGEGEPNFEKIVNSSVVETKIRIKIGKILDAVSDEYEVQENLKKIVSHLRLETKPRGSTNRRGDRKRSLRFLFTWLLRPCRCPVCPSRIMDNRIKCPMRPSNTTQCAGEPICSPPCKLSKGDSMCPKGQPEKCPAGAFPNGTCMPGKNCPFGTNADGTCKPEQPTCINGAFPNGTCKPDKPICVNGAFPNGTCKPDKPICINGAFPNGTCKPQQPTCINGAFPNGTCKPDKPICVNGAFPNGTCKPDKPICVNGAFPNGTCKPNLPPLECLYGLFQNGTCKADLLTCTNGAFLNGTCKPERCLYGSNPDGTCRPKSAPDGDCKVGMFTNGTCNPEECKYGTNFDGSCKPAGQIPEVPRCNRYFNCTEPLCIDGTIEDELCEPAGGKCPNATYVNGTCVHCNGSLIDGTILDGVVLDKVYCEPRWSDFSGSPLGEDEDKIESNGEPDRPNRNETKTTTTKKKKKNRKRKKRPNRQRPSPGEPEPPRSPSPPRGRRSADLDGDADSAEAEPAKLTGLKYYEELIAKADDDERAQVETLFDSMPNDIPEIRMDVIDVLNHLEGIKQSILNGGGKRSRQLRTMPLGDALKSMLGGIAHESRRKSSRTFSRHCHCTACLLSAGGGNCEGTCINNPNCPVYSCIRP